jgi:hypothetical protein
MEFHSNLLRILPENFIPMMVPVQEDKFCSSDLPPVASTQSLPFLAWFEHNPEIHAIPTHVSNGGKLQL